MQGVCSGGAHVFQSDGMRWGVVRIGLQMDHDVEWEVLQLLDRRLRDGRDEVLVHWACSWLKRADYEAKRADVVQLIAERFVGLSDEQVLVQWACSCVLALGVAEELLVDWGMDEVPTGDGNVEDAPVAVSAGVVAVAVKRRRVKRRNW